jgi:hypothetical protein
LILKMGRTTLRHFIHFSPLTAVQTSLKNDKVKKITISFKFTQ